MTSVEKSTASLALSQAISKGLYVRTGSVSSEGVGSSGESTKGSSPLKVSQGYEGRTGSCLHSAS